MGLRLDRTPSARVLLTVIALALLGASAIAAFSPFDVRLPISGPPGEVPHVLLLECRAPVVSAWTGTGEREGQGWAVTVSSNLRSGQDPVVYEALLAPAQGAWCGERGRARIAVSFAALAGAAVLLVWSRRVRAAGTSLP